MTVRLRAASTWLFLPLVLAACRASEAKPPHDPPAAFADVPSEPSTEPAESAAEPAADPSHQSTSEALNGASTTSTAMSSALAPVRAPEPLPAPLHAKVDRSCGHDPGVGTRLRSFALSGVDGKRVSDDQFRSRVLLVNFWGTWCQPCLAELPEFDRLYRRYRKHGLSLLAIATDEDPLPVKDYVSQRRLAAKVAIGGQATADAYQSNKFPFSFVVDKSGVIKASYRGFRPECMGKLEADVRTELENLKK